MSEAAHDVVRLRDGRYVEVRPIRPDDAERLTDFHSRLSAETIHLRYFVPHPVLTAAELHHFTHVDGDTRLALVGVCDDAIIGVGRYESIAGTDSAEAAFVVRDDYQGLGLGGHLVALIAREATRHGKRTLVAETLPENAAMRKAFRRASPTRPVNVFRDGVVEVQVVLGDGEEPGSD